MPIRSSTPWPPGYRRESSQNLLPPPDFGRSGAAAGSGRSSPRVTYRRNDKRAGSPYYENIPTTRILDQETGESMARAILPEDLRSVHRTKYLERPRPSCRITVLPEAPEAPKPVPYSGEDDSRYSRKTASSYKNKRSWGSERSRSERGTRSENDSSDEDNQDSPADYIDLEDPSSWTPKNVPEIRKTTQYNESKIPTTPTSANKNPPASVRESDHSSQPGADTLSPPSIGLSSSTISFRPRSPSNSFVTDRSHHYTKLYPNQFRLIRILPAKFAAIHCEILHTDLNNHPNYVAISYAWGDSADTRNIQLEGASIPITTSLHGALESLREKSEPILIWADALCIDQQNRNERTQQVRLMTSIYSQAESVAIWLGPEADRSAIAIDFLVEIADHADAPERISRLIASRVGKEDFAAAVTLFERMYWRRLWVVQEVFNARKIAVYCGTTKLPWSVYKSASQTFRRHKSDLDHYFPGGAKDSKRHIISQNQLTYSQVLVHQGPGSLSNLSSLIKREEGSLLEILRACRRKLAADPRDKVFGILGILPENVRQDFQANYDLSVKEVYTNVVEYLLYTTEQVNVICEAIYFPLHTSSATLPTWVPDWSHVPQTTALGLSYDFAASRSTKAKFKFLDEHRNKLEISAIPLDTINRHGISVGTLCALADFLMAFLHWRALLLGSNDSNDPSAADSLRLAFCRTICLGHVPPRWEKNWPEVVYYVFASLLLERLPHLPLDRELQSYLSTDIKINRDARRRLLQEHVGSRMMGRCFCLTKEGRLGMGTGFMAPDDLIVVPLGCNTPIILRPEGNRGEYRLVGDMYLYGYMQGKAIDQWKAGERTVEKFVLR
jgi:hypothetical protein